MRSRGRAGWVFETAEAPPGDGSVSILEAFGEKGAGLFPGAVPESEAPVDPPVEAPAPADPVVEAPPVEPAPVEDPPEVAALRDENGLFVGKYKTLADWQKGSIEANELISRGAHKEPPPVEEPEYAPTPLLLSGVGDIKNLEDLAVLMAQPRNGAKKAFEWVLDNYDGIDPDIRDEVWQEVSDEYARAKPSEYAQRVAQAEVEQRMATLQPTLERDQQAVRLQGIELAAQDPVFLAFRQDVADKIQENPQILAAVEASTDPVALASLLKTLAQNIASPRLYQQQQEREVAWNDPAALAARIAELNAPPADPAAPPPAPGAPAPPRSQGPSTVPAGDLSDKERRERTIAAALAARR